MKLLISILFVVMSGNLFAATIDVFFIDGQPIKNYKSITGHTINYWNLSNIKHFENKLSEGIPSNETEAKIWADKLIERHGKKNLEQMSVAAYKPLMQALRARITDLPAIVFDSKYVVYGVVDVQKALNIYRNWERQQ